ncbi:hypothetical protein D3C71_1196070 [compost metagenome]
MSISRASSTSGPPVSLRKNDTTPIPARTSTPMITADSTITAIARARPGGRRPSTVEASTWVSWNTSNPDSRVTTRPSFNASHMPNSINSQAAMRATGGLGGAEITRDMAALPGGWPMVEDATLPAPRHRPARLSTAEKPAPVSPARVSRGYTVLPPRRRSRHRPTSTSALISRYCLQQRHRSIGHVQRAHVAAIAQTPTGALTVQAKKGPCAGGAFWIFTNTGCPMRIRLPSVGSPPWGSQRVKRGRTTCTPLQMTHRFLLGQSGGQSGACRTWGHELE